MVMPHVFTDNRNGYVDLVNMVVEKGMPESPRGLETLDVPHATWTLADPDIAMPIGVGRNVEPAIGVVEALGLVGGVATPNLLESLSSFFSRVKDGEALHGAYGPRVRGQLPRLLETIREDLSSRRGAITVWAPVLDQAPGLHDYPCTISFVLRVRSGKLDMSVFMRSNDVFKGVAYDVFMFRTLQRSLANALSLPAGRYFHTAASLHVYASDFGAVRGLKRLEDGDPEPGHELHAPEVGRPGQTWDEIADRARTILDGRQPDGPTKTESAFADTIQRALDE